MLRPLVLGALATVQVVQSATTLFRGATIVTWDDDEQAANVIRRGAVLVVDDEIKAVHDLDIDGSGNGTNVPPEAEIIDVSGKIITPGFIDTHAHRWQTAYRTIAADTTLWQYFNRYGEFAAAGLFDAEDVYVGQIMGSYEALDAGTTTTLDHAHHTWSNETVDAGLRATIDSGARAFWAYAFRDVEGFTVEDQITNFRSIVESGVVEGTNTKLGVAFDSFGPSPVVEQVEMVVALAKEANVSVITTHSLYGLWGYTNSPSDLHQFDILNTSIPVVFSHASFIPYNDYQLLRSANQYISITPESEMHYGHLHPKNHHYQDQASLGVDTHFTFSVDILTQARLWLQSVRKTMYGETAEGQMKIPVTNPMSAGQAFGLATRNGALALRRPDLGIIAPGAQADLVIWDTSRIGLLGWVDPVAAVMLHANIGDIEHVLVAGDFKKRDKKIIIPNYEDLKARFLSSAAKLQEKLRDIPLPEPTGQWASGADLGETQQVDIVRGEGTGYGQSWA